MYELDVGGRPTKLTPALVEFIELGGFNMLTLVETCVMAKRNYTTYRNWMIKAKATFEEHGEIEDRTLREFYTAYDRGMMRRKELLINLVLEGALTDPDLALKLLERKYPDFSNKQKQLIETKDLDLDKKLEARKSLTEKELETFKSVFDEKY